MDINRENLDTIFRGLRSDFVGALNIKGEDEAIADIVMDVSSSTASERFDWLGDLPDAREWLGPRVLHQLASYNYEVFNKTYEVTCRVQANDISDDRIGIYSKQAATGGEAMRFLRAKLIAAALDAGQSRLCYDGQNFFDTAHPVGKDGDIASVSNLLDDGGAQAAHPWYLADVSRTVKPIIFVNREKPTFDALADYTNLHTFMHREFLYGAKCRYGTGFGLWQSIIRNEGTLNYTTLMAAYNAMVDYRSDEKDEEGRRKKLGMSPGLIICGQSNYLAAKAMVSSPYLMSTTDPFAIATSTTPNPFFGLFRVLKISWLP